MGIGLKWLLKEEGLFSRVALFFRVYCIWQYIYYIPGAYDDIFSA